MKRVIDCAIAFFAISTGLFAGLLVGARGPVERGAKSDREPNTILNESVSQKVSSGLSRGGDPYPALPDGASEEELIRLSEGLGAQFWKTDPRRYEFVRRAAYLRFGKLGARGLTEGRQFLLERNADGLAPDLFRAVVEGCFTYQLPRPDAISSVMGGMDEASCLTIIDVYLHLTEAGSLKSMQEIARELMGGVSATRSKPRLASTVDDLVVKAWLSRGASGVEDLLQETETVPPEIAEAIRAELAPLAALDPVRTQQILVVIAKHLPDLAGEMILKTRLPVRSLTGIGANLPEDARTALYRAFAKTIHSASPRFLTEVFDELPASAFPEDALCHLANHGLVYYPSEAMRWVSPLGAERTAALLDDWQKAIQDPTDPERFLSARLPLGHFDESGVRILGAIVGIAEQNPERAEMYLQKLPESLREAGKKRVYPVILSKIALNDPEQFLKKLAEIPPEVQNSVVEHASATASFTGSMDITKIADGLSQEHRVKFLSTILSMLDGPSASTWTVIPYAELDKLGSEIIEQPFRPEYSKGIVSLAKAVVRENPERAVRYVNWLPAGTEREQALSMVVERWTEADPRAACNWAEVLPAGRERDIAIVAVVKAAPSEIDIAMQSISAISSSEIRFKALKVLADAWMPADPARFGALLKASGFGAYSDSLTKAASEAN